MLRDGPEEREFTVITERLVFAVFDNADDFRPAAAAAS